MDIQMPKMNGYDETRALREAGYKRPILALTAFAFENERQRCLEAGCNERLTKPVTQRDLIEALTRFTTLH